MASDRLPLWKNLRWPQLAYAALAAIVLYAFWQHAQGTVTLSSGGIAARILLLTVATLVFIVYLQNVYRFGLVPDYSLKCRYCNGPVNRYSEFCEHCGGDLIAEEKLTPCPKCGVDVYEGTKFCPECGATVSKPAKKKGKKGHKHREEEAAPSSGWDTPVDAVSGFPPVDDERR